MGLYMAVIPTRGEVEAEKKRIFGHGGGMAAGMVGVVRVLVEVWVRVCQGEGLQGCKVGRLQGCKGTRTDKAYLYTSFIMV